MGISGINTMQAVLSAGTAMAQVQRQGSVVTNMKGREGVLETEIKLDSARGGNVEKKQEELEEVQKKKTQVQSTQMDILSEASKKLEEARKEDQKAEAQEKKAAKKKAEEKKAEEKRTEEKKSQDVNNTNEEDSIQGEEIVLDNVEITIQTSQTVDNLVYSHVDVRL